MPYFKPKGFVLAFRNRLIDKYNLVKVSDDPSPLVYTVTVDEIVIAWLSFEDEGGTIKVALEYSIDATEYQREELLSFVKDALDSGYGDDSKILTDD